MRKSQRGGTNVFADIGQPDAEGHLLKAQLVARIQQIIRARDLTQAEAAALIGASQPDVSRMLKGNFREISAERLVLFLTRLGCDVNIVVKPQDKRAFAPIRLSARNWRGRLSKGERTR